MTPQEHQMYDDNCVPVLKDGVMVCDRKICTTGVDDNWLRAATIRQVLL